VTGALVGYGELVVGEAAADGVGLVDARAVAEAVAVADPVAVAVLLSGARAVPLNNPEADGDSEVPLAFGLPEPVQAVIPRDSTITAMTLAARMPTQCLFPSPARGNLDNG
jgi:hypothetical protein